MRRTWTRVGLSVVCLTALASYSGAQDKKNTDGQPADKPATAQQIEDLNRSIKDTGIALKQSVDRMTERVSMLDEKLDLEVRSLKARGMTTDLNVATAQKDINELKELLSRIRVDLDAMRGRPTEARSFYSGPGGNALAPALGQIRIDNTYFMPVDVVVNGVVYQMMPGQRRYASPVPAGTFTYEVLGIQAPVARTVAAGETFVVSVFPR